MPPQAQTAQSDNNVVDYNALITRYPWVTTRDRYCILSPDSDGFLSGLLVTNFLNWEVAGFYDGKILISKRGVEINECVFLDMEINRPGIGSIGNHLIEYNRNLVINNHNFDACLQPNMLRGFDGKNAFQRKYPFGTIHLLLSVLQGAGVINDIQDDAISPLLFADGVGNNLFGYPENCLDWINYLKINQDTHILHKFLCETNLNFYQIMQYLQRFFVIRDSFNATGYFDGTNFVQGGNNKRTGHKLKITNGQGAKINLTNNGSSFEIHTAEVQRVQGFIRAVAVMMGWQYLDRKWNWGNFDIKMLQKGLLSGESTIASSRLNNQTYKTLFDQNPFSLAMTASNRIEYTLE